MALASAMPEARQGLKRMIAIGITGPSQHIEYAPGFPQEAALVRRDYLDKVFSVEGAVVYIVPAVREAAEIPEEYLRNLDALVVTGGSDIDPKEYGAERDPHTGAASAERDAAELALVAAAKRSKMPVLGICRGMQVLNVSQGGKLHQHLPDVVHNDTHQQSETGFSLHQVRVDKGSALAAFSGARELQVNTFHHQGVAETGAGIRPVAWAEDGLIEAIETPGAMAVPPGKWRWPVMGVQWHPEAGSESTDYAPFQWLAQKAAAYRARRSAGSPVPIRKSLAHPRGLAGKSAQRAREIRRDPSGKVHRTAKR